MTEFKDRLNVALTLRDMSPADLARRTGVNEGAISQYRKGGYKANQRNLELISNALKVSIPWLMGANVPMDVEQLNSLDYSEIELLKKYRRCDSAGKKLIDGMLEQLVQKSETEFDKPEILRCAAKGGGVYEYPVRDVEKLREVLKAIDDIAEE